MHRRLAYSGLWLAATAGLLSGLFWLDHHRGGPASMLSRCNLLLTRSESPPAEVLIIGSSRSGTALDPIAMQNMLAHAVAGTPPTVERIAMGHNPLRAGHALLENYLKTRGPPEVLVLELMFMTQRSVDFLARHSDTPPEKYIFRRDINLLSFKQILSLPAVAMPFSEREGMLNRWRFRLRGAVLRAGALVYQFLRRPAETWQLEECDEAAWTKEPAWAPDFAFSYGEFESQAPPQEVIQTLESLMIGGEPPRALKGWQSGVPTGQRYPYDFGASYRQGEVALLESMLELASDFDVPVVLLPLPLYGYSPGADDMRLLNEAIPAHAHVFDLYGEAPVKLDKFWYDDGHLEIYPAGALTTAILAQHLLDSGLLKARVPVARHD